MELERLKPLLESLLFVADEPVAGKRLAETLGAEMGEVEAALQALDGDYQARGLRLQRKGGRVQMVTAPEAGPYIERFLGLQLSSRLSKSALETLAVVAYRQPVTRAQIEKVRGVSSDGVLRTLLSKGLVEEVGRLEQAGRPILYGTTFEFLQHFGLRELNDLPPLEPPGNGPADSSPVGTMVNSS